MSTIGSPNCTICEPSGLNYPEPYARTWTDLMGQVTQQTPNNKRVDPRPCAVRGVCSGAPMSHDNASGREKNVNNCGEGMLFASNAAAWVTFSLS
jgi:hypothetical protein